MTKSIVLSSLVALTTAFAIPSTAGAAPCKSTWQGLTSNLKTFNAVIAKGVCKYLAKTDGEVDEKQANKCIEDYEKAKKEAEKYYTMYQDTNTGSGKIGPRGFAHARTYYGGLMTERLFIGREILSDEYTVRFEGTGGKKKKDYTVTVCFVDAEGDQVVDPYEKTFRTNDGKFEKTFSSVAGARPMVYLRSTNWVSANKNKYKFRGQEGEAPATVQAAKKAAKSAKKTKKPVKKAPRPRGNRGTVKRGNR